MKILVTGNMGYVGSVTVKELRRSYPDAFIIGYDMGYFAHQSVGLIVPEGNVNMQIFGDIRNFPDEVLDGVDFIVHLAAISNDPMDDKYEEVTYEINWFSTKKLAEKAKKAKIKSFVFASSCSIYGSAEDSPRRDLVEFVYHYNSVLWMNDPVFHDTILLVYI